MKLEFSAIKHSRMTRWLAFIVAVTVGATAAMAVERFGISLWLVFPASVTLGIAAFAGLIWKFGVDAILGVEDDAP